MYHLKYFIPLVIEANKHNIQSNFYAFYKNDSELQLGKTINNHPFKHVEDIEKLSKEYEFNFELRQVKHNDLKGVTFFGERRGVSHFINNKDVYKVVLVCLRDYVEDSFYDWYIDKVDAVVFPSKFFAEHYNKISDKNLYLGSPKYDVVFDKQQVKDKYNVHMERNILVMYPETNTAHLVDLKKIYDVCRNMGYGVIVKGRNKQPAPDHLKGDIYVEEDQWFPHASMELIAISNLVVGFNSSVHKEGVMLNTPSLNIDITGEFVPFRFFFNYFCCKNILGNSDIQESLEYLLNTNMEKELIKCRKECLFESGNVSKKIIKEIYEKT